MGADSSPTRVRRPRRSPFPFDSGGSGVGPGSNNRDSVNLRRVRTWLSRGADGASAPMLLLRSRADTESTEVAGWPPGGDDERAVRAERPVVVGHKRIITFIGHKFGP